jgi:chemotaxis protein CheX
VFPRSFNSTGQFPGERGSDSDIGNNKRPKLIDMDVKFINPFLQGTVEVLKKMAFIEARPGKVYLKQTALAHGDVSGVIGITGDMIGSLAISFNESCICHLLSSMLGESFAEANQDVFDGVGELTNMISGVARTYMEKDGLLVYAAIPSVVYGKNHTINHILKSPSIVIPFVTDQGAFVVDICIKRSSEEPKIMREYRVVNTKTPASAPVPNIDNRSSVECVQPATWGGKIEIIKKKLCEIKIIRDDMVKQLTEKPFMEISQRRFLKSRVPLLDAQIQRLRLDLSTAEMLSTIKKEDMENPKLVQHYQHYESSKPKS